jgi:hypothetical protein
VRQVARSVLDDDTATLEDVRGALEAMVGAFDPGPGVQEVYVLVDPMATDGIFVFEERNDRDVFEAERASPEGYTDDAPLIHARLAREVIAAECAANEA